MEYEALHRPTNFEYSRRVCKNDLRQICALNATHAMKGSDHRTRIVCLSQAGQLFNSPTRSPTRSLSMTDEGAQTVYRTKNYPPYVFMHKQCEL